MGFYYQHLKHWFDYFSVENFHITTYEKMNIDKKKYLRDIFRFLSVDDSFSPQAQDKRYQLSADYTRKENGAFCLNTKHGEIEAVSVMELDMLRQLYAEDVKELRNAFALDTTLWEF
jgi:hypothetical protein